MSNRSRHAYAEGTNPLIGSWTRPHHIAEGGTNAALKDALKEIENDRRMLEAGIPTTKSAASMLRTAYEAMHNFLNRDNIQDQAIQDFRDRNFDHLQQKRRGGRG